MTHILKSTDHNSIKFMEQSTTCVAAYKYFCTCPGSMHLTCLLLPSPPPLPPFPHPYLFIECFSNFVRINHSIVLLVKYNFSTINVKLDYDSVSDKFSCPQYSSRFSFKQGLNCHCGNVSTAIPWTLLHLKHVTKKGK